MPRAMKFLLLIALIPVAAEAQISWSGGTLSVDCDSTAVAERRCVEVLGDDKHSLGPTITCDATARTNGRCPDTIAGEVPFPRRKRQACTDTDVPGRRGRCLYGRGPAVDTSGDLPACAEADWGEVVFVIDELQDYFCNGSSFVLATGQEPGFWWPTLVQCGAGPTHDVWPDGGALEGVDLEGDLPPCTASTDNLRMWVGATNIDRPWLDGTLYRCQNPTWATSGAAWREDITDAGINAVCRSWQNTDGSWIPGLFASAPTWYANEGKDIYERWQNAAYSGSLTEGRARISVQRNPVVEQ